MSGYSFLSSAEEVAEGSQGLGKFLVLGSLVVGLDGARLLSAVVGGTGDLAGLGGLGEGGDVRLLVLDRLVQVGALDVGLRQSLLAGGGETRLRQLGHDLARRQLVVLGLLLLLGLALGQL